MKPQRAAPLTAPLIYADRLFPADFATRAVARRLYARSARPADRLAARPYRSALVCGERAVSRSGDAVRHAGPLHFPHALQPGRARSRSWASPRKDGGAVETDARKIWRKFAEHYHLFRGTPTRLWLDQAFAELFGMTVRLSAADRRRLFRPHRRVPRQAGIPAARAVRAVQDRGDRHDRKPARSARRITRRSRESGWKGRVVTAYRPDPVVDPEFDGFRANLETFGELTRLRHVHLARLSRGAPACAAPIFKQHGATSTDHGHAYGADRRSRRRPMPSGCSPRSRRANSAEGDAELFRAQMLTEMARMSLDDGLVMQIHPGSLRNHNPSVFDALRPRHGRRHPDRAPTTCAR